MTLHPSILMIETPPIAHDARITTELNDKCLSQPAPTTTSLTATAGASAPAASAAAAGGQTHPRKLGWTLSVR